MREPSSHRSCKVVQGGLGSLSLSGRGSQSVLFVSLLLVIVLFSGCDLQSSQQNDETSPAPNTGPRIVSLTPALTQMLIDMGMRDQLVGVSQEDNESLGLPVCGSYNQPLIARIVKLEPDVVVTESADGEAGVPATLRELADQGVFKLAVVPHSRSIADIERALADKETGLGEAVGDTESAERARKLMATRMEMVQSVVADAKPPRVLMLINPSTLGALGTDVTHDELLKKAGGINAAASFNIGYLKLSRSQLERTVRPDVILILEPNGRPIAGKDDVRLRALEGLTVPAVVNNRIVVIRHPQVMLPSTALPAVLVEMAKAIHPERADDIDEAYEVAETVVKKAQAHAEQGRE